MGKKSKRLQANKVEPDLRGQDDKLITDLIERRKLQQDALNKIMDSMDSLIAQLNHSTSTLLNKSNSKRISR